MSATAAAVETVGISLPDHWFGLPVRRQDFDRTVDRMRANCGFMDGHVSLMSYFDLFTLNPANPASALPVAKTQIWTGLGRSQGKSF